LIADLVAIGRARRAGETPVDVMRRVVGRLNALPAREVVRAETVVPHETCMSSWYGPHLPDVQLVRRHPDLALLFLFHRSGFVRQAALDSLHDVPSAFAVGALAKALLCGDARWQVGWEWKWTDKVYGKGRRAQVFDSRPISIAPDRARLINNGLVDASSQVRVVAADALIEDTGKADGLEAIAERLLADASPSVRMRGDYLARSLAGKVS
jgi:hypothetical protein